MPNLFLNLSNHPTEAARDGGSFYFVLFNEGIVENDGLISCMRTIDTSSTLELSLYPLFKIELHHRNKAIGCRIVR